jgi:hypothetical protein
MLQNRFDCQDLLDKCLAQLKGFQAEPVIFRHFVLLYVAA